MFLSMLSPTSLYVFKELDVGTAETSLPKTTEAETVEELDDSTSEVEVVSASFSDEVIFADNGDVSGEGIDEEG